MRDISKEYAGAIRKLSSVINTAAYLKNGASNQAEFRKYVLQGVINVQERVGEPIRKNFERKCFLDILEISAAHLLTEMKKEMHEKDYSPRVFLDNSEDFLALLKKLADEPKSVKKPCDELFLYSLVK